MWIMQGPPGPETVLNGRRYLYFAGTGYLGLQAHPALAAAAEQAAARYGVHTATTRTGFGTCPPVSEVERRASELLQMPSATYLVSGYAGNFAMAAALSSAVDLVLIDESAHDCLRESVRWLDGLQRPPLVFQHRDAQHLDELLRLHMQPSWRPLVMSDGVFPISGRLAPVAEYLKVLARYERSSLLIDDAHALAVLGEQGRGSLEHWKVDAERINRDWSEPAVPGPRVFHTATLSKAVGGHGGVIAGSAALTERIRQASGWFRASSAPAAAVAAATAKGLEIVQAEPQLRARLAANVSRLRAALAALGLEVESSPSPIIGIALESAERMQEVQQRLIAAGIAIAYARDYAGAGPDGMLRIAVFATHTPEMLDRLVAALGRVL